MTLSVPVPLAGHHVLDQFRCGQPDLDHWLTRRAQSNQVSGATRTFVVCDSDRVVAYHALASGGVATLAATGRFRRDMPDSVPVAILARLATYTTWQGRGLGRSVFQDCARRVS